MVGELHHERALVPRMRLRHAPRDVVRLATRIDEQTSVEIGRERLREALHVFNDMRIQIPRVAGDPLRLIGDGCHNCGVGVANMRDIVIDVEVSLGVRGIYPDAFAPHQVQRLVI